LRGYDAVSAITGSLSVLVALDPNGGSSKLKKANKAGIKIMGLEEWLNSSDADSSQLTDAQPATVPASESPCKNTPGNEPCESVPVSESPCESKSTPDDDPFASMSQGSFDF